MKTVSKKNNVARMGIQKTTQCGMVVNAKAFEMLARQYSDPVKAIIQEIGANAADSHVRAEKEDVPFSVKLPNSLDPHLRIRDYGIGMSKDVIYDVYINYMQSDKTNTNKETGCFGIGSKTPLAYADQFNITTYNDGVMTMYSLVKNEEGVPELNEFGDYETDEENGVEISFSVKEDDFDRFGRKAYEVYSFFNTRPTVTGNGSYRYDEEKEVALEGENWKLYGGYGDAHAVMGNIAYVIDDRQFDYNSKYRDFLYNSVRLEIPLGDLNITPSREALEYTEHTINGIKKAIDKVFEEINGQIEHQMSECKSWWQAKMLAQKIDGKLYGMPDLPALTSFKGVDLKDSIKIPFRRTFNYSGSKVKAANYDTDGSTNYQVYPSTKAKVVIQDVDKGFDKKCRYFCGENDFTVYLIKEDIINTVYENGLEGFKEALRTCDEDDVIYRVSELPEPPKTENPNKRVSYGTRKKTTTVREFLPGGGNGHYGHRYESRWWAEEEVDMKKGSTKRLYVRWHNYSTTTRDHQSIDVQKLHKAFSELGIKIPTIYGLKDNQVKTACKQKNWMCFKEWSLLALETFLSENEGWEEALQYKNLSDDSSWVGDLSKLISEHNICVQTSESPMGKLIAGLKKKEISKFSNNILAIARGVCYNLEYEKTDSSLGGLIADVESSYPFVTHLVDRVYLGQFGEEHIKNLFELVDAFDQLNLEGGN